MNKNEAFLKAVGQEILNDRNFEKLQILAEASGRGSYADPEYYDKNGTGIYHPNGNKEITCFFFVSDKEINKKYEFVFKLEKDFNEYDYSDDLVRDIVKAIEASLMNDNTFMIDLFYKILANNK